MPIAAFPLGLGFGFRQVDQLARAARFGTLPVDILPAWSVPPFLSGIVVCGVTAAILNALMPDEIGGHAPARQPSQPYPATDTEAPSPATEAGGGMSSKVRSDSMRTESRQRATASALSSAAFDNSLSHLR